jgi:hypothetical protein
MQTSTMKALLASLIGIAVSPFERMESRRYTSSYKQATPRPENLPAGNKLARKAAKGILTGNYRTRACQGMMRQLSARRGSASPV